MATTTIHRGFELTSDQEVALFDQAFEQEDLTFRVNVLTLVSVCLCLAAVVVGYLTNVPGKPNITIALTCLITPICFCGYVLRKTRFVEIGVHLGLFIDGLIIAASPLASGVVSGDSWVLFQLAGPIAALAIGKPRSAMIAASLNAVILTSFFYFEMAGQLPAKLLLPPEIIAGAYGFHIITMITIGVAMTIITRRSQTSRHKERLAREAVIRANTELAHAKIVADRARRAAEEANISKSQFLANMSHELRTPLNAIINVTQFVIDGVYTPEELHRVIANSNHLLGLINDVLDLSKIESGRMDMLYEPLELQTILSGVHATALGLTKGKDVKVKLEVGAELPAIWSDKKRVRQILLNLLSNAAKFTERGEIVLRAEQDGPDAIRVSVQDTGIGIAVEDQALIFEEFRQVDKGHARRYEGTGLGLPIAKNLVKMLGGRLWLESTPGRGSTFFFTLPLQQPKASHQPPNPMQENGRAAVIVDDDPHIQAQIQGYLEHAGYRVYSVLDSREALDTIRRVQPVVVILDILMAERAGFDILAELKATPEVASIPVVMCSSSTDQRMSLRLGAARHIAKPVQREQLLQTLAEVEKI